MVVDVACARCGVVRAVVTSDGQAPPDPGECHRCLPPGRGAGSPPGPAAFTVAVEWRGGAYRATCPEFPGVGAVRGLTAAAVLVNAAAVIREAHA